MRKLILWNLITLDGRFEGVKNWDLDWHARVWGQELEQFSLEQLRAAGALVFGRVTYQGMAAYWQSAEREGAEGEIADFMNNLPKIVFSRTLEQADWNNTRIVRDHPVEEILRLKQEAPGDLFLFGSADLASTLIQLDLIDEYRLVIVPLLLGTGSPLFKSSPDPMALRLLEARALPSGGVLLRYEPTRNP